MYLLVLAGDGIGPEITAATLSVLRAASERFDLQLRIEEAATGHAGLRTHGHTIHPDIVEKARRAEGGKLQAATAMFNGQGWPAAVAQQVWFPAGQRVPGA